MLSCDRTDLLQPRIEFPQCGFALQTVALFSVAHSLLQSGQQVERDIRGLKVARIGLRDVVR
jgi:hypothetical protein